MLISSIIGAVGALGSAIVGGIKSAQANEKFNKLQNSRRLENEKWYNTKMNEDYTQRTDVQNAITRQRELLDEQIKRGHARSIVGGASPEAAALEKEAANKSLAETSSDIASKAADYKDQVEQQYQAKKDALDEQEAQQYKEQAQSSAAAAGQAVNAGLGLVGQGLGEVNLGGGASAAGKGVAKAAAQQAVQNQMNQPSYSSASLASSQQNNSAPRALNDDRYWNLKKNN